VPKYRLPEDLYSYQKEDYLKLLSMDGALNFSEMGVGKTPESLAVIEEGGFKNPLIICPNSLRLEWERQIEEWVGEGLTAVSGTDSFLKLRPILDSFREGKKYKVLNYETLRNKNHLEVLSYIPFDIIICDEIHKLRNPKTKLVKGAWKFFAQHPNSKILGLSGSPIMNYPNDLYVPLSIAKPDKYPPDLRSWRDFMYKYCLWSDGRYGPYVYGTRNLASLRQEIEPFVVRRTKKEVLPFLPEKYYRRALLEMKSDQRKLYNQMETELRVLLDTGEPLWSTNVLSCLTRLRQINLDPQILGITASSAKTEFLMDLVDSTDEKLVIYSCFEKYINLLSTVILKDLPRVVITGEVPPDDRIVKVRQFQEDPSIKLCLGTIQTMGEGITLTASSNCILADRWWNQPTNLQAEDRLHRIGQRNPVQVILPVVKDSVDSTLDDILERKNRLSESYYGESQVRQSIIETIR